MNTEQEQLKEQLESKTAALTAKMATAREKRSNMNMMLRGRLGRKDQRLEAFGIRVKS